MELQSILRDPQISNFLQQIPSNQHLITLKQLIYIGIKIVTNSFQNQSNPNFLFHSTQNNQNKENKRFNLIEPKNLKPAQSSNKNIQNQKKFQNSKNMNLKILNNRDDKIQSALLRQISKIRIQLQSLTNKVYDYYFDENKKLQNQDSSQVNPSKNADYIKSFGFNYSSDIPTFSPSKIKPKTSNNYSSNPFLKRNILLNTQNDQNNRKKIDKQSINYEENKCRYRAKSNLIHLDDTQVRQALYTQKSQPQIIVRNKEKKSRSLIESYQQKKKDQQNYFYQLNADKKNLKELQKFIQSKSQLNSSYRYCADQQPLPIDHFKKKAKSKIKPLIQRDRLKYQTKVQQQNFQKGFKQYQYSAHEYQNQNEESEQQESQSNQQELEAAYNQQVDIHHQFPKNEQKSQKKYVSSPEAEYERERNFSNPNFGFYKSKEEHEQVSQRQKTFSKNQSYPDDKMNSNHNQSSFSQFSEFSMSSNNSKRQVGKISRRRQ